MHTTVITVGDLDGEQAIAEITNVIHELPGIDTGMYDELFEAKDDDVAAQSDRDALWR